MDLGSQTSTSERLRVIASRQQGQQLDTEDNKNAHYHRGGWLLRRLARIRKRNPCCFSCMQLMCRVALEFFWDGGFKCSVPRVFVECPARTKGNMLATGRHQHAL